MFKIRNDIKKIVSPETLNTSQAELLNDLFMTDEIFAGINQLVKQNDEVLMLSLYSLASH